MTLSRDIYVGRSSLIPRSFLESLFVTELIQPSHRIWIVSPWINDLNILDNSSRQFSSINADWPAGWITLSQLTETFLSAGVELVFIMNEDRHNEEMVSHLENLSGVYSEQLKIIRTPEIHEKGILTDHFTLDGSMNFTYSGLHINQEFITYRCDPSVIGQRKLVLEERWADYL